MTKQILGQYYNDLSAARKCFPFKILVMGIRFHIPVLSEFEDGDYWVPLIESTEIFEFYSSCSHFHSLTLITSSLYNRKLKQDSDSEAFFLKD